MTQKLQSKRTLISSIICLLIVLLIGSLTLLWQTQQQLPGQAKNHGTSGNIVGAPTLSAATVDKIFTQMGSPMVGTGSVVEQASRQTNIDDAFALGVWWTETNDGAAGVGRADRNPGSVRGSYGYPSAYDGYTIYPSYAVAITDWFSVLKSRYVSRGLNSVYSLCYSYVGTESAPQWAAKVVNLMYRYRSIAPPPEVTATATPKPQQTATSPAVSQLLPKAVRTHQLARLAKLPDNMMSPDNTGTIIPAQNQPPVTQVISQSPPTRSPSLPELPLVCFGLLAALAIALAGLHISREPGSPLLVVDTARKMESTMLRASQAVPITDALPAGTQFIVSNAYAAPEYSPVTESLSPYFVQEREQVPQLDFPPPSAVYQAAMFQHLSLADRQNAPIPASSVEANGIPDRPTLPMSVAANHTGLLKRHRTTEALGRRTLLAPSRLRLIPENAEEQSSSIEA